MRNDPGKAARLQAILDEQPVDGTDNQRQDDRDRLAASDGTGGAPPRPPLPPERGGGNFGGMEPRIATLEADMKHVKDQLDKLSDVPKDVAVITERTSHLATKAEVTEMGNVLAGKVQRNMYIIGGCITILMLILKFFPLK